MILLIQGVHESSERREAKAMITQWELNFGLNKLTIRYSITLAFH